MIEADALERAREHFRLRAWGEAYARLSAVDRESPLEPDDLERMATAAYLVGRDAESGDIWARAHQAFLGRGDPARAARCAFWLGYGLLDKGKVARGGGWIARAHRLLGDPARALPVAQRRGSGGRRVEAPAAPQLGPLVFRGHL